MTPTWTGKAGEPVPAMLRHTPRVTYTEAPGGIAIWTCAGCDASAFVPVGEEPEKMNVGLCPAAVAQRLAELEAREASVTKAVDRARRGIVRWLRSDGPGSPADVYGSAVGGTEWTTSADAISAGRDAEWCEANPEIPPATEEPR